ncbi:MAG: UDP-4-amino-4,6-dideoxy-N-acetyl-beta-L-altrosamine transaminase [Crocinitomicaceae bacterium]
MNQFKIPYGKQSISQKDIDGVIETLKSDFMTQGPKVPEFEERFAEFVGAKYAIACSNGTAALHLATMALEVSEKDHVISCPNTFVATTNSVLYCGGNVSFCDIYKDNFTIDLEQLEKILDANPGKYSGVMPIHFAGYPVDMERLGKLAKKHDLWIIEDACHAPGAKFQKEDGEWSRIGSCEFSEMTCFSFHPVKHIACGEGGMVTTNSKELYEKMLLLRTHGVTKNPDLLEKNDGPWYYEMPVLGYNYRLTELQASLGITQLEVIHENLEHRQNVANHYFDQLRDLPVELPLVENGKYHAYHLFVIRTEKRKELQQYLMDHNIFSQVHYIPVHLQPYYKKNLGTKEGDFPVIEDYYSKCLSIPMFHSLSVEEQDYVIDRIRTFFS